MLRVFATGRVLATGFVLAAAFSAAEAGEVPQAVKDACSGDYQQHCKMHKPESDGARDCMAGVFDKLSDPCVTAILNSDLVEEQARTAEQKASAPEKPQRVADSVKAGRKAAKLRRAERRPKRYAQAKRRRVANRKHEAGSGKVARYINRGTRIANFYVSKAFAKAFH